MERRVICESCEDPLACISAFRTALSEAGLEVSLDANLSTIPGSIHLHLKMSGEKRGVLEYTMDVQKRTAFLSWHTNRYQPWIEAAISALMDSGCSRKA